jgi:hypothetical protein
MNWTKYWAKEKYNCLYLEFRTQLRHLIPAAFKSIFQRVKTQCCIVVTVTPTECLWCVPFPTDLSQFSCAVCEYATMSHEILWSINFLNDRVLQEYKSNISLVILISWNFECFLWFGMRRSTRTRSRYASLSFSESGYHVRMTYKCTLPDY